MVGVLVGAVVEAGCVSFSSSPSSLPSVCLTILAAETFGIGYTFATRLSRGKYTLALSASFEPFLEVEGKFSSCGRHLFG